MPFLPQGKTNWKFIGIVVVWAVIVGGGILFWQFWSTEKTPELISVVIDDDSFRGPIHHGYGFHPGLLGISFSTDAMLGDDPNLTREKVIQFIQSIDLEMSIEKYSDGNVLKSITISKEGINKSLFEEIKNDFLVKEIEEGELTYTIVFKEGIYKKTLKEFIGKYPRVRDNFILDYFAIPPQPISVIVAVPVGLEEDYAAKLETEYPNEIIGTWLLMHE